VSHRRWGALPLTHRRGDEFAGPGIPIGTVTFERDAAGAVTGLRAGNGRTLGVWFGRIE
jgi:hypothetical protein